MCFHKDIYRSHSESWEYNYVSALLMFFKYDWKLFVEVSRLIFQMIQSFYNEAAGKKIKPNFS
ncbi:unnamed protein product [marine sediment metagenome]|uniref:Uncharacterized protein n=1 Tax=marine sediment metagenome TaxID=412755 RepID=X1IVJ5_9ZZZZ